MDRSGIAGNARSNKEIVTLESFQRWMVHSQNTSGI
jgi:hypothetical protein